jgi:DNA-binding ferritin-like protein
MSSKMLASYNRMKESGLLGLVTTFIFSGLTLGGIAVSSYQIFAQKFQIEEINKKVDLNFKTLDEKIDKNYKTLDDKIDKNFRTLDEKIDKIYSCLEEKMDSLGEKMYKINYSQEKKMISLIELKIENSLMKLQLQQRKKSKREHKKEQ